MMRVFLKFLICLSLTGCTTHAKNEKTYVSIDLPVESFEKIKTDLEASQRVRLKSRGEAHITLITPPEYKRLRKSLSAADIQAVIDQTQVLQASYKPLCVGKGTVKGQSTYFVVVAGEEFINFRKILNEKFIHHGGAKESFDPGNFYPHVTIGFTDKDLHFEDGVIKDLKSCLYSWPKKDPSTN